MMLFKLQQTLLLVFAASGAAQQITVTGGWNFEEPQCNGLNVTLTYSKFSGESDYVVSIQWGDMAEVVNATRTIEDGESASFSHTYAAAGTYVLFAQAESVSLENENSYGDTLEIDESGCSFDDLPPPTASPARATISPTITGGSTSAPSPIVNETESDGEGIGDAAYVDFLVTTDPQNVSNTDQHFIVRILDPEAVAIARGELNKTEGFKIVAGTIIKKPAPWNFPKWSFHLDPETIIFGDIFIEVCDANVEYVEDNLATVNTDFLPNSFWCPWSTRVLEELDHDRPAYSDAPSDTPSQAPTLMSPSPTANAELSPTIAPLTYVDFVATADRTDITDTSQHFIVRITELSTITFAREELELTDGFTMVSGTVVKEETDWNPNWSFYLEPSTIFFSSFFPESCDAEIDEVEENLDEVGDTTFLPDGEWCPWGSRILSEVSATQGPSAAPSGSRADVAIDDVSSSERAACFGAAAFATLGALLFTILTS